MESPMTIVIHHNPDCGTSRNVLSIIRAVAGEPVVIEYLEAGWTRGQLQGLFAAAGLTPREALRSAGRRRRCSRCSTPHPAAASSRKTARRSSRHDRRHAEHRCRPVPPAAPG
jgi:hypothetical protein